MIIYTSVGAVRANIHQTDDSDVYTKISDEEYASIKFTYNSFIPFDRGDYVILYNNKYTLKKKPAPIEEDGNNKYVYTLKFESSRAELSEVNFELFDSTSLLVIPIYDSTTIYCKDSVVSYSSKVWRYIYTTGDLGKTPSEGTYWTEIPVWSVSTAYVIGNFVYSSNVVYKCLKDNTGQPLKEGDYWTVVNTAPAFDFTTVLSPANYAKMICDNMNRARSTQNWVVGYTIPYDPKEQAFSNVTCLEAAGTVASLFETEFWVDMNGSNFQLNIGKRVYTTTPEITLSQGKNNGLVNITRNEITESKKVTRLIALGGEKNLYGTYRSGSKRLMLPDRYYIDSANIDLNSPLEDVQVWDDIYPCMQFATDDYDASKSYLAGDQVLYGGKSWDCILACTGVTPVSGSNWKLSEGQITSVVTTTVTASTTSFKFIDANMTFNPLDPAYIMSDGTRPKVHFVTGNLAGYEFPITSFDNTTKEFTISQIQDSTDSNLPTVGYTFSQYDRFNLVDLYMPQTYVIKAENRLLAKATDYLNKYSVDQVSYSSSIDVVWATNNAVELRVGQIVKLVSTTFNLNDEYRIISLTRNITLPYKYMVELSNTPYVPSKITKITNSIAQNNTYLQQAGIKNAMFSSKTFRGAREAIDMSFDPDGSYFTEKIKPLIVETSAVLAGTNEQQFSLSSISFSTVAGQKNYISWTAGSITDDKYNTPSRAWAIPQGNFTASGADTDTYYCYIKSPKSVASTSASVVFDTLAHKTNSDANYWWFLIGTLGSVKDNMRQFYTSYGWTFINGGTIYGQRIQSANGSCYFDLQNNEIGGVIKFVGGENAENLIATAQATANAAQAASTEAQVIASNAEIIAKLKQIVPSPLFDDADLSSLWNGITRVAASSAPETCPSAYCACQSGRDSTSKSIFTVTPGQVFYFEAYMCSLNTNGNCAIGLQLFDSAGTTITWYPVISQAAGIGWTKISGNAIIPSNAVTAAVWAQIDLYSNYGYFYFTRLIVSDSIAALNNAATAISNAATAQSTANNALNGLTSKQDAIVNGVTMIVGGYINTDLIQVDSLIAKHFTTGTTGERITLNIGDDNALKIYDASNIMRVKLGYKSGVPAFIFYDSTGAETFNLSSLGIGGSLTATNSIIINNGTYARTIDIDSNGDITIHGNLHVTGNAYAEGEVSAYGAGSGSGSGGGLINTVYGYSSLGGTFSNSDLNNTFNAYTINRLANRIETLETNPSLTQSNIIAALGFTPYNSTNPSGYITISALSNYAFINHTHDLARYSLKAPNYIDGLSTSNFRTKLFGQTANGYYLSVARWQWTAPSIGKTLSSYGTMIGWGGEDTGGFIAVDYSDHNAVIGGTESDDIRWAETILHSGNYNSYAPKLDGTGATGTWGISISGTAANANALTITTGAGLNKVLTSDASGNATWQSGISVTSITTGNITSSGNITATGEITAYATSDINLKTSISILSNPFELIKNINPVSYLWNNTAKQLNPNKSDSIQYGVIAQELELIRPEWVHYMYGGKYKGVDYVQMIPVLLACIQQQQKEIDILKNKMVK